MSVRRSRRLFELVQTLQSTLISYATGGTPADEDYRQMRAALVENPDILDLLPSIVRVNRELSQTWPDFKRISGTYQGRREHLWKSLGRFLMRSIQRKVLQGTNEWKRSWQS